MKTMTCRQMGGPCDTAFHGASADEIIKAGAAHIKERMMSGDLTHKQASDMMDAMMKDPEDNRKWYEDFKLQFAALPED